MFNMKEVKSSQISKIGYDPTAQKLRIQFKTGSEYDYDGVSQEEHDELIGAESIGRHFGQKIRNVKEYVKVEKQKDSE